MNKNYLLIIALLVATISFGQNIGDIIITEIMQNPRNPISDNDAEWFEVYNTTDIAIDLNGWTIRDNGTNLDTIENSLVVAAGGFIVLGVNSDMAVNGGVVIDYQYSSSIKLANGSDALILKNTSAVTIDSVIWDNGATFPDPNGKSMSLDPGSFNGSDNDDGTNWCEATTALGDTQFGTPGAANDVCGIPCTLELGETSTTCDTVTEGVDTYTAAIAFSNAGTETFSISINDGTLGGDNPSTMASGTITVSGVTEGTNLTLSIDSDANGTCHLTTTVISPVCDSFEPTCVNEGDLIVTEIMQNPASPVSDNMGEWFEIYNTTDNAINLRGYDFVDDNNPLEDEGFTISETLMIPAGGYLLFANNGDSDTNGGITPDWVYASLLTLGNGTDGITIQCNGNIVDIVIWDNGDTFPDPTGNSMTLSPDSFDATANDDGANWCEATSQFGTDFGTPGAANDECAAPCPFSFGASSATCDGITDGIDTYTATLDFSGGGSLTYAITVSAGTRSGDDPSAVESGTITVSGIPEGTDVTINIIGIEEGTCNITRTITSAVCVPATCSTPGSVVITEIMQNPSAVSDSDGEWFELFNFTDTDIDLQGWDIIDDNTPGEGFTVATSLILPANGYLVFANNGDVATNGGIVPDYAYDTPLTLGNGTDGLQVQCNGTIIDIVIWDGGTTFPDPNGVSMELDINHLNAIENNFGQFWGMASTPYGDGDLGTPGAMNTFNTSIREIAIEGLNVFPNPTADGTIRITTNSTSRKEVAVYNMLGVKIFSTSFEGTSKEMQLGSINPGVYFLRIKEGDRVAALNVVVGS